MMGQGSEEMVQANTRKGGGNGIRDYLSKMARDKTAIVGIVIVSLFILWAIIQGTLEALASYTSDGRLAYILLPSDPFKVSFSLSLHAPSHSSLALLLGTNDLGESILSRILYAMPRDAFVSIFIVLVAIAVGSVLGITAGYRGGWVDTLIMRITDSFLALPALILVIAISIPLKAGFSAVLIGLTVVWWPTYTRFFRAQVLQVKSKDYVQAAKLYNVKAFPLFLKYLFLNSVDPVIAYAALDFGNVILTYSTLAFLGIGISTPYPELGSMASDGLSYLPANWWYPLFPGLAILVIVVGFVLVGDRFQDLINNRVEY